MRAKRGRGGASKRKPAEDILQILRDEYPGEEAWKNYVDAFREEWDARQDQALLLAKFPEDLAIPLAWHFGDRAWDWYTHAIPALGNRTPRSVHRGADGDVILRSAIMRIPV